MARKKKPISFMELTQLKMEFLYQKRMEEKAHRTIDHYDYVLSLFLAMLKGDSIDKEAMLSFKEELDLLGMSNSTYNNYIVIIDSFLKFCRREDLCLKKRSIQVESSLKDILYINDYKRLLRWSKKLNMNQSYMIMKVLAETGIRISELHFFTAEAVKKGPYIQVRNKGKNRNVILTNSLRKELKNYCIENKIKSGYIFVSSNNKHKPAVEKTIWRHMKKVAGAAKVSKSKVHPHAFRHLFALNCLENNMSLADVADILGHSSIETTRIYAKTTDEMKKAQLEKMKYREVIKYGICDNNTKTNQ